MAPVSLLHKVALHQARLVVRWMTVHVYTVFYIIGQLGQLSLLPSVELEMLHVGPGSY